MPFQKDFYIPAIKRSSYIDLKKKAKSISTRTKNLAKVIQNPQGRQVTRAVGFGLKSLGLQRRRDNLSKAMVSRSSKAKKLGVDTDYGKYRNQAVSYAYKGLYNSQRSRAKQRWEEYWSSPEGKAKAKAMKLSPDYGNNPPKG